MVNKQKLELTWIGKDTPIKAEPRILVHDPSKDYGDKNTDNMLIYGDNLLALKALEQDYAGKVKCIYIDPPYNTGSVFGIYYDDNLEHSTWLSLMYPRIKAFHTLLKLEGSLWISIDDDECFYLKVLCDEIFGRQNFLQDIIWNSTKSVTNTAIISPAHTHTLVYFKDKNWWIKNRTKFRMPESGEGFANPDNDPRGPWKADPFQVGGWRPNQQYEITNPITGQKYLPNKGSSWKNDYKHFQELLKDNRIVFGKNGTAGPQRKRFLYEAQERGRVSTTLWTDLDTTTNGTRHSKELFGENPFPNPKPENLLERILNLSTDKGDLVLDSFLGSGTTAAVAHKMGRKYIGIELGKHCHTHCIPRLQKVIDGTDQGGISKAVGWKGGGGFKYYYLAPSLLNKDKYGQYVISKEYNADMLAAAVAKHEGFKYAPSAEQFWKQGQSSETDYIYTTTSHVGAELLAGIAQDMKAGESLLVCCKSFDSGLSARFANITVKKIPAAILGRCEFGKDNYNLNIINPPVIDDEEE